jgi:hypothetical protein
MVNKGANLTYNFTPATGWHVSYVWVDGKFMGPLTNYTFTNITMNHTIEAWFATP